MDSDELYCLSLLESSNAYMEENSIVNDRCLGGTPLQSQKKRKNDSCINDESLKRTLLDQFSTTKQSKKCKISMDDKGLDLDMD